MSDTATVANGKAKAKAAPGKATPVTEAKADSGAAAKAAPKAESFSLVTLKSAAISKDIGPTALRMYADMQKLRVIADEAVNAYAGKRYDTLALITNGIRHAVTADKSIVLTNAFSDDKKAKRVLNDQIKAALGIIEPVKTADGNMAMRYTKAAADVLNSMSETAKSNFTHLLDKAAQAAQGLIDLKADVKFDDRKGTLMITGPAVKKAFGQASILVNEKQTQGEGDKAVKLSAKPSYQALANIAREKRGHTTGRRIDSRAGSAAPSVSFTSEANFSNLCRNFISTLNALEGKMTDKHREAAQAVLSALDKALG